MKRSSQIGLAAVGVILVATYGMSETCGGCVYDGRPLEGTRVALDDDGRVHLGGPSLASGYLADPERTDSHFVADTAGERWFRTDDHGEFLPDGRLQVHGRLNADKSRMLEFIDSFLGLPEGERIAYYRSIPSVI